MELVFPRCASLICWDIAWWQPPLLSLSIDRYVKEKGPEIRKSEYGDYTVEDNRKKRTYEHTIRYDKGIMVEHIMTSASVPEHYDFYLSK